MLMNFAAWWDQFEQAVAKYDLLCHPFYVAWSNGELTRTEIANYAANYYHHVNAFPQYLEKLEARLGSDELKKTVEHNRRGENGHGDLWLDFAEGMGADRNCVRSEKPISEIDNVVSSFSEMSENGTPAEALAMYYAYESQVPRVAEFKEKGLFDFYGADKKTAFYFTVHKTADLEHADSWRESIETQLTKQPELADKVLAAGEKSARVLWEALDGIERARKNWKSQGLATA